MVHPQVGNTVPYQQIEPAKVLADEVQTGSGEEETEVRQSDELSVLGLVQRAGGVEVVDTAAPTVGLANAAALGLLGVVVVTGHVVEQIQGPTEELLEQEV